MVCAFPLIADAPVKFVPLPIDMSSRVSATAIRASFDEFLTATSYRLSLLSELAYGTLGLVGTAVSAQQPCGPASRR